MTIRHSVTQHCLTRRSSLMLSFCNQANFPALPSIQDGVYLLNAICEYTRSLFALRTFGCYIRYLFKSQSTHNANTFIR
ncbi:hypothetical protein HanIR_Chr15g0746161 [Helianthus annuus]|nr:hypothetical protein HanIR_Chr15g0746161 [Helianthus annuus]